MRAGRHFLQVPGPTNVPDRIVRSMARPAIDHRSPEFAELTSAILPRLRAVYGTGECSVVVYPSSGTGAWEAALVNVLRPGDRVLAFDYGHFSAGFAEAAVRLGFTVDVVSLRWGQALEAEDITAQLRQGAEPDGYRAVLVVHNETSTGVLSDVAGIRAAIDAAGQDPLLIVDAVSSLASVPFAFDEWNVDVCLTGSQKGLMLPPGLGILCVSPRAVAVAEDGGSPRNFFDWRPIIRDNAAGFFPYTPATLLLFGLDEALRMLVDEEGLSAVYARHRRLAEGVRAAVDAWGLPAVCEDRRRASETLTAVAVPAAIDSSDVVRHAREHYGLSLGVGLGQLRGRAFRIGHLGSLNELEVIATVAGTEMTLAELGAQIRLGAGVEACQRSFLSGPAHPTPSPAAAGAAS